MENYYIYVHCVRVGCVCANGNIDGQRGSDHFCVHALTCVCVCMRTTGIAPLRENKTMLDSFHARIAWN